MTILRHFSDLRQSYDNWRIHRTFTTFLRPILRQNLLDVLRQLGSNSQIGLLPLRFMPIAINIYPKICHTIILRYHNFCLKMIL